VTSKKQSAGVEIGHIYRAAANHEPIFSVSGWVALSDIKRYSQNVVSINRGNDTAHKEYGEKRNQQ